MLKAEIIIDKKSTKNQMITMIIKLKRILLSLICFILLSLTIIFLKHPLSKFESFDFPIFD